MTGNAFRKSLIIIRPDSRGGWHLSWGRGKFSENVTESYPGFRPPPPKKTGGGGCQNLILFKRLTMISLILWKKWNPPVAYGKSDWTKIYDKIKKKSRIFYWNSYFLFDIRIFFFKGLNFPQFGIKIIILAKVKSSWTFVLNIYIYKWMQHKRLNSYFLL